MRLIALTLPVLPALVVAHYQPQLARHRNEMRNLDLGARAGLLDGLLGGGSSSADSSTAAPSSDVASSTAAHSSAAASSVAASSSITSGPASSAVSSSGALPSGASASVSGSQSVSSNGTASVSSTASSSAVSSAASSSAQGVSTSVNAAGQTVVITQTYIPSVSTVIASSVSAAAASSTSTTPASGSPISTGAIIGISVGVGAVVIGLIALAIWRMKRRGQDLDEAIRWPELNRHGDSDAHHALPARQTGQHGIETSPLERTLSNSSSLFRETMGGQVPSPHSAVPMALNGSNFGAASSLDYPYDEKVMGDLGSSPTPGYYSGLTAHPHMANEHEMQSLHAGQHVGVDDVVGPHEMDEDYTTYPPVMGHNGHPAAMAGAGVYDSGSEDGEPHGAGAAARQMTVTNPDHVTYGR
ncbi:hypothetical protein EHS25_003078 [Saitozyma podzolica]|uniref:Mid2 domain-containing protein n=1 Tax=Saitozyma podzolica TaxID=1890683 RepID=A0A427YCI9_9TREE|nr:hypothetical protein EHS25_003078 [Saitozyma podzolica]